MKYLLIVILYAATAISGASYNPTVLEISNENPFVLRGTIDEKMVAKFAKYLETRKDQNPIYIYIDTHGGTVFHTKQIVGMMIKHRTACYANNASSGGFIILQMCNLRFSSRYSILMMHKVQVLSDADEYTKIAAKINTQLFFSVIEKRAGLTPGTLQKVIGDADFDFTFKEAMKYNLIDVVFHSVRCTEEAIKQDKCPI